jgi:hypothetical protein
MHAIAVATFRGALRFAAHIPDPMVAVVHVGRIDEQRAPLPAGVSNAMQHVHVHSRPHLALQSGHGGKRRAGRGRQRTVASTDCFVRTNFRSQLIAAYDRGPQPVTETKSN